MVGHHFLHASQAYIENKRLENGILTCIIGMETIGRLQLRSISSREASCMSGTREGNLCTQISHKRSSCAHGSGQTSDNRPLGTIRIPTAWISLALVRFWLFDQVS